MNQPTERQHAIGRITEVLGDHMAPGMEIDVAVRAHGIPFEWSAEIEDYCKTLPTTVGEADCAKRQDLRDLPLVTIDGEDAMDFDNAVFCKKLPKKGGQLFVAIADVSYYVEPNSLLDQEAKRRGNSVYFPGQVIPMSPEVLSNGFVH